MTTRDSSRVCECGCGAPIARGRFVHGHNGRRPVAERLRERLIRNEQSGCLELTGFVAKDGYGRIGVGSRVDGSRSKVLAHRLAWELANGPIPDGLCVLHSCDNPPCCEPSHLFLGTKADNLEDMARKGRGTSGPLPYGVFRANSVSERWSASVKRRGKRVYLGTFDTVDEAAAVAADFKRRRLGRPAASHPKSPPEP